MSRTKRALRFAYVIAHALIELGGDLLDSARDRRRSPEEREVP